MPITKRKALELLDQELATLRKFEAQLYQISGLLDAGSLTWIGIGVIVGGTHGPSFLETPTMRMFTAIMNSGIEDIARIDAMKGRLQSADPKMEHISEEAFIKLAPDSRKKKSNLLKEREEKIGKKLIKTSFEKKILELMKAIRHEACLLEGITAYIQHNWPEDIPDFNTQHVEVFMGHKVNIGDFSGVNAPIQVLVGDYNRMVATLDTSGKSEQAQALQTLLMALLASKDLSESAKEDHIVMLNQIGEEAAKSKPNKPLLKALCDGLVTTLKAVPDVANAVTAAMPFLSHLHL